MVLATCPLKWPIRKIKYQVKIMDYLLRIYIKATCSKNEGANVIGFCTATVGIVPYRGGKARFGPCACHPRGGRLHALLQAYADGHVARRAGGSGGVLQV